MDRLLLATIVVSVYILFWFFLFLFRWRREITIKNDCTMVTQGTVIGYYTSTRLKTPIVEYTINNRRYKQRLRYFPMGEDRSHEIFYPQTEDEYRREILKPRFIRYSNSFRYEFKQLFPIGSEMTVYYHPKNPKLSFVERYAGFINYYRNGMILSGFAWLFFMVIFFILKLSN